MRNYKHAALNIASQYGFAGSLLRLLQKIPLGQIENPTRKVDPHIREFKMTQQTSEKVLLPLFPSYLINEGIQSILAHAFHTRHVDTIQLSCDGSLPVCCLDDITKREGAVRSLCNFTTSQISEAFGTSVMSAQDVLPPDYSPPIFSEDFRDVQYREIDLSKLALASTRKHFKVYNINLEDETQRTLMQRYLATAAMLVDAYKILFDEHEIAAVVGFEDHYIYTGTAMAVASLHGVPAYSVDLGYQNETLMFGRWDNRNSLPMFTDYETVRSILEEPLTRSQQASIDELMNGRMNGTTTRYQYSAQTDKSISSPTGMTTVGMFTNLAWDASVEVNDVAFPNMFDWISTTIDEVSNLDRVQLIIKTHPAEAVRSTREPVGDWIFENLSPLPENVEVLAPDTDVNTYELASDLDLAIVYTSIVGLEMAYLGLPVIVAGDSHYRDLDFTGNPRTPQEYIDLLRDPSRIPIDMERMRRYSHYFHKIKHVPFPFVASDPDGENIRLSAVSHDTIVPGNEPLDRITDAILSNNPVLVR